MFWCKRNDKTVGCEGTVPNTAPLQEMNNGKNGSPPDMDCSEQALLGSMRSQEESPNPTSCSLADVSSSTERITESTVITLPDAGMASDCTVVQSEDSSRSLCIPSCFRCYYVYSVFFCQTTFY